MGCQSVTSRSRASYHTLYERGYPELSHGPNSLNISGVIRELEFEETFHWILPRMLMKIGQRWNIKWQILSHSIIIASNHLGIVALNGELFLWLKLEFHDSPGI